MYLSFRGYAMARAEFFPEYFDGETVDFEQEFFDTFPKAEKYTRELSKKHPKTVFIVQVVISDCRYKNGIKQE